MEPIHIPSKGFLFIYVLDSQNTVLIVASMHFRTYLISAVSVKGHSTAGGESVFRRHTFNQASFLISFYLHSGSRTFCVTRQLGLINESPSSVKWNSRRYRIETHFATVGF